jgi:Domain of unknown function (DUF4186)
MDELPKFEPVKVKCTSTDCDNDKHCYRPKRGQWKDDGIRGECQSCGDTGVDMSVTRAMDANNPETIFQELGREFIRDHFLNKPIDERSKRQVKREGLSGIRARVRKHLSSRIGGEPDAWDGRQTPLEGSILNMAQHATATCCRRCAYYWYAIPKDRPLTESELDFCERMLLAYLDRRDADLKAITAHADQGSKA